MPVRPLLKWPGGKYHHAPAIVNLLPKHDTYVEPFAGGASVFWNKPQARTEVLNDTNGWLIDFYRAVQTGHLQGCTGPHADRTQFEQAKACAQPDRNSLSPEAACCAFRLNRLSYHGNLIRFGPGHPEAKQSTPIGSAVLSGVSTYETRLKHTQLLNEDFETAMRKHDSPTTVHYLDPPWAASDHSAYSYSRDFYHGEHALGVERVARVAASMKGKVLISYGDSPAARSAFQNAGLHIYLLPGLTSRPQQGATLGHALLVTNFPIPGVRK